MNTDLSQFEQIEFTDPDAMEAFADETPNLADGVKRRIRAEAKAWRAELGQGQVERLNRTS